jgi:DNA polymerase-3 subunit alpha (Gram-positive type)
MLETIIILDLETTRNQLTKKEEIIEISAVEINEKFEKLNEFSTLVNPLIPLTRITKKVTGLNDYNLKNQESIKEILPKILEFISNKNILTHNAFFDYKVLDDSCEKHEFYLKNSFIDSLKIAKSLFPYEKNNLSQLKYRFGINLQNHRAREDVYSTIEILNNLSKIYYENKKRILWNDLSLFKINNSKQLQLF